MRRMRQTKIIATIGPGSGTEDKLASLFLAGADVFRFNFSHGTHEEHAERLEIIRSLENKFGRPIGVFADLQGPKLRVGNFSEGRVMLESGAKFRLDLSEEAGSIDRAPLPHPEIFAALRPGAALLLDDGRLRLEVKACGADYADTLVQVGGALSNHKGVNVPDVALEVSPLTEKDRRDLEFALEIGIGLIALSFVQRPEDVEEAQRLIGGRAYLITKLEKPSAVEHLEEIVDLTNGVMVARGDLSVEMPPGSVPALQKRIIRTCRRAGKPVIVATQMLDSMVTSPTPTRAEASDVANAVYEGADAVMLSAETAVGDDPVRAVAMMDRIIKQTENDSNYAEIMNAIQIQTKRTLADTITESARKASITLQAAAIVTFTMSGSTAVRAARKRPPAPILAITPTAQLARTLAIVWGIHAIEVEEIMKDYHDIEAAAIRCAKEAGFADKGDILVITAGIPIATSGNTNIMRLLRIED